MRTLVALFLAAMLAAPVLAQDRGGRERQLQKQGAQPRERMRDERREMRRERHDGDRHRFTREERRQLRQDLLDANRDLKGRK
jgi:Ni/Co efflux regulator RcnB